MSPSTSTSPELFKDLASGLVLIVAGGFSIVLMLAHPSVSAGELSAAFAEAAHEARIAKLVHAFFIVTMTALVFGYSGFSQSLGLRRPLVRAGLITFVLGAITGAGAAVINGLVFPEIAMQYAGRELAEIETAHAILAFGSRISDVLAQNTVLAWSAAVVFWSLVIVRLTGTWRWLAVFGLVFGVAMPVALLAGHLVLDVRGFGIFMLGQMLWAVGVGAKLVTAPAGEPRT